MSGGRLVGALAPIVAAGAVVATGWGGEAGPAEPITARASITPRAHFFGDRVAARVDVTVDGGLVDPDGVRLLARFPPYRRTGPIDVERRDLGRTTILSFTTSLQCIDRACVRGDGESRFRPPPAVVQYFLRADPTPAGLQTAWPELILIHRLPAGQAAAPVRGRMDELTEVSYRIPPAVLGLLLAAASAGLVLWAAAAAALRLRRRARPPSASPAAADLDPPELESVLALVRQAPDDDARRVALDMLARTLAADGASPLAGRARRLAWAASPPAGAETQQLADAVRRALEEAS